MNQVTRLLDAAERGEPHAAAELLPLVYDELRRLAAQKLAGESPGQTVQATALVHEAYLRLVGSADARRWENRRHFFGAAAEAMRRILIESARRKHSLKRGGDRGRVDVDQVAVIAPEPATDLVALDEALIRLARTDPDASEVVKLRYFGGLSMPEIATLLSISPRSVDRLWSYARAWLHREMTGN